MSTVTICDDSKYDLAQVRNALEKYAKEKKKHLDIFSFDSPENLVYELDDDKLTDIYVLDVSMPGINGFELADEIRKHSDSVVIIFLTTIADQASEGYKAKALRYVIKFNLMRDLPEAIDAALAELALQDTKSIILHRYNDHWRVSLKDIVSVTRISRQLCIATASFGELTDTRGIKDFFDLLNDQRFIFIDRSCFVNIDHIVSLCANNSVFISDGQVLPVSRRSMPQLKQVLIKK